MRYFGERGEHRPSPPLELPEKFIPCRRCGQCCTWVTLVEAPICWDEVVRPQTWTEGVPPALANS